MAEKNLRITVLTDKTSWMNKYNVELVAKLEEQGHYVRLIHAKEELPWRERETGDVAFFLSCFELVEKEKLALHKNNIVVHESALPSGKGWSPMSWQILEGRNTIPMTLFEATETVDAGDIYLQDTIMLCGTELIGEWQKLLGHKIIEMCLHFIKSYPDIIGKKQVGLESFYKRRTPKDSELDVAKTLKEQFNLLRIVDNNKYPAFFELYGQKYTLKIEKAT